MNFVPFSSMKMTQIYMSKDLIPPYNTTRMNISKKISIILLAFLPSFLCAQVIENHIVGMDQTLFLEYVSPNYGLTVNEAPLHGTYVIYSEPYNGSPSGLWHLDYTPNTGYLGPDSILITVQNDHPIFNFPIQKMIAISVVPASIEANDDFVSVEPGNIALIDVLSNDVATSTPYLEVVSLTNNVDVEIVGSQIEIQTDPDYRGIAKFSYTACVDPETCSIGMGVVFVENVGSMIDTFELGTNYKHPKKNLLPLSDGYQVTDAPNHGELDNFGDGNVNYTPDEFHLGKDTFTIAYNTNTSSVSIRTFIIETFDTPAPLTLAVADQVEIAVNGNAVIDVLANDLGNNLILQQITLDPVNGTAVIVGNEIDYTANSGFVGLEKIQYKVCTPNFSNCEITDLLIFVDNQNPANSDYELITSANTPLIIDYKGNLAGWDFVPSNSTSAQGGILEYHSGIWNGVVNGQNVEGENLLIYYPPTDMIGMDNFSLDYCLNGECVGVNVDLEVTVDPDPAENPHCVYDCVWPGDADADGKVTIKDVLAVGYCAGEVGIARQGPATDQIWYPRFSENWEKIAPGSGVNLKHIDVDGDGVVTKDDVTLISSFYGEENSITVEENPVASNVPIYFVSQTQNPQPGDHVVIDILLGAEPTPAIDVSGITFSLNYNTDVVVEGSFKVNFKRDSWLSYDSPVLNFVKRPFEGKIDVAYTRVEGTMASGFGKIGTVDFIIEDEIDGIRQGDEYAFNISVENTNVMNGAGFYNGLFGEGITLTIANAIDADNSLNPEDLAIYPNPTSGVLNVHLNGKNNFRSIEIVDIAGRILQMEENKTNHIILDVSAYQDGMYFLRATTDKGFITKRFQVYDLK